MTDKEIRDAAMENVMWTVGRTDNDVTRYISDAVANQIIRDEQRKWIPVSERLPECEKEVEVTVERRCEDENIRFTCRAMYEDGKMIVEDSFFNWEYLDYEDNVEEGWFEAVSYAEEFRPIDDFVIAWRKVPEPYRAE